MVPSGRAAWAILGEASTARHRDISCGDLHRSPLRPSGHHGGKVALGRPRQLERPVVVSAATWNVADLPARTPGEWHELSGFGLWKAV